MVLETCNSLACHAELREARDYGIRKIDVFSNDTCIMLNKVLNAQVSDTTGDDSSNAAKYITLIKDH